MMPEHNLIPNESELAQIAANVFLFFTVLIYLLTVVRLRLAHFSFKLVK